MAPEALTGFTREICRVVRAIPRGRVATYGQVAALAGRSGAARRVGAVLRDLPDQVRLPWHRVVAAPGRIAPGMWRHQAGAEQAVRLRAEGVAVGSGGRVDLARHAWRVDLAVPRL